MAKTPKVKPARRRPKSARKVMTKRMLWAYGVGVWLTTVLLTNPVGSIMSDAHIGSAVRILDNATLQLPKGWAFDLATDKRGRTVSGVAPGATWVALPVYLVLKPLIQFLPMPTHYHARVGFSREVGTKRYRAKEVFYLQLFFVFLVMAPLRALLAVGWIRLGRSLGAKEEVALFASLALTFGTILWTYSEMSSRQGLATLLIWNALAWGWPLLSRKPNTWMLVGMGLAFGVAVCTDYLAAVPVLWLCYLIHKHHRRLLPPVLAGGAVMAVVLAGYHTHAFGAPWKTAYDTGHWKSDEYVRTYRGEYYRSGIAHEGLVRHERLPSLVRAGKLLFSPFKGLFLFSPVLLLGVWGFLRSRKSKTHTDLRDIMAALFLTTLLINSSLWPETLWSGIGKFFGPRHLVLVLPALAMGIFFVKKVNGGMWATLGLSVVFALTGVLFQDQLLWEAMKPEELQGGIRAMWQSKKLVLAWPLARVF